MTKEVINVWTVANLDELIYALVDAEVTADLRGHNSEVVYPNKHRVSLVEETLANGTSVLTLQIDEVNVSYSEHLTP